MAEHQNGAQTHRVMSCADTPRYQMTRLADVLASIFILLEFCFRLETMLLGVHQHGGMPKNFTARHHKFWREKDHKL